MHLPVVHAKRGGRMRRDGRVRMLLPVAVGAAGVALIRVSAPTLIKAIVNAALRHNRRLSGHVDSLHLHLRRGEVAANGIRLTRPDHPSDQITIDEVRFDVRPTSLLRRRLSGGLTVENVRVAHGSARPSGKQQRV